MVKLTYRFQILKIFVVKNLKYTFSWHAEMLNDTNGKYVDENIQVQLI